MTKVEDRTGSKAMLIEDHELMEKAHELGYSKDEVLEMDRDALRALIAEIRGSLDA